MFLVVVVVLGARRSQNIEKMISVSSSSSLSAPDVVKIFIYFFYFMFILFYVYYYFYFYFLKEKNIYLSLSSSLSAPDVVKRNKMDVVADVNNQSRTHSVKIKSARWTQSRSLADSVGRTPAVRMKTGLSLFPNFQDKNNIAPTLLSPSYCNVFEEI